MTAQAVQAPVEVHPEQDAERAEITEVLRPRLAGVAEPAVVDRMVEDALDELLPARVTTFLPSLVERQVRDRLRDGASAPPAR